MSAAEAVPPQQPSQPAIYVEYCTGCGYAKRFSEFKAHMQRALPNVDVIGNPTPPRMSQKTALALQQARGRQHC
jgi:hypothetical protein